MSTTNPLLAAALEYALLGWHIIPIQNTFTDGKWHKKPTLRTYKKWQTIQPQEKELRKWFSNPAVTGLAVLNTNGHCVRDFDKEGAYERWRADHPDPAVRLPTVRTGRGYHVHFHDPTVKKTQTLGDGELRACASLNILPPSMHPLGKKYEWEIPLPDGPLPSFDHRLSLPEEPPMPSAPQKEDGEAEFTSFDTGDLAADPLNDPGPDPSFQRPPAEAIEDVIASTLPTGLDQRNRLTWSLSLGLRDLGFKTAKQCKPYVLDWWRRCRPVIEHKEFKTTWAAFITAWANYDPEKRLIIAAMKRAETAGLSPHLLEEFGLEVARLGALCRELQRGAGDGTFFLAMRALLHEGVNPKTMQENLVILRGEDYIRLGRRGKRVKGKRPKASTYRYLRDLNEVTHLTHLHINPSVGGEGDFVTETQRSIAA